jgi:hypothetical protein
MPRTCSLIDKIRTQLTWGTETPDPNKCGCRNVLCCRDYRRLELQQKSKDVHHAFGLECEEFNLAWQRM